MLQVNIVDMSDVKLGFLEESEWIQILALLAAVVV